MDKDQKVIRHALASLLDGISYGNLTKEQVQPLIDILSRFDIHTVNMSIECWEDILMVSHFLIEKEFNDQIPMLCQKLIIVRVATLTMDIAARARFERYALKDVCLSIGVACLKKWFDISNTDTEKTRVLSLLQQLCLAPTTQKRIVFALCKPYFTTTNDVFHFCNIERRACPMLLPSKELLKWTYKRGDADIGCENLEGNDVLQVMIQVFQNLPMWVQEKMDNRDVDSVKDVARYLFRKGVSSSVTQANLESFMTFLSQ